MVSMFRDGRVGTDSLLSRRALSPNPPIVAVDPAGGRGRFGAEPQSTSFGRGRATMRAVGLGSPRPRTRRAFGDGARVYAPTIGQGSQDRHRPRVKSGKSTGALSAATLISESSDTALSAAAS